MNKEKKEVKQEKEFKSPRQIAAAKKAIEGALKANNATTLVEVWKAHYLLVGHKVLGRLLLGKDPLRGKGKK